MSWARTIRDRDRPGRFIRRHLEVSVFPAGLAPATYKPCFEDSSSGNLTGTGGVTFTVQPPETTTTSANAATAATAAPRTAPIARIVWGRMELDQG